MWLAAWTRTVDVARTGLQATLLVRHPQVRTPRRVRALNEQGGRLFVNFDPEVMRLIRETRCLQRMGFEVPPHALSIAVQEEKFKHHFSILQHALREFDTIMQRVDPSLATLVKAHIVDVEKRIKPGLQSLTWQSMNIDAYVSSIRAGVARLSDLFHALYNIIEHRVQRNLTEIAKVALIQFPAHQTWTLQQFISKQVEFVSDRTRIIEQRSLEIERALSDLVAVLVTFRDGLPPPHNTVDENELFHLREHYGKLTYVAVRTAVKNTLFLMKRRLGSRMSGGFLFVEHPFFEVDVELSVPNVSLTPSLEEIQEAVNQVASLVLKSTKDINWWAKGADPTHGGVDALGEASDFSFFTWLAGDKEIVKVVLFLTGSIEQVKKNVTEHLQLFRRFDHIWATDKSRAYDLFLARNPSMDDFSEVLRHYTDVEKEILGIAPVHNIGCISLKTLPIKNSLRAEAAAWKSLFSRALLSRARMELSTLQQFVLFATQRLSKSIIDFNDLDEVVRLLADIKRIDAEFEAKLWPVRDIMNLLSRYQVRLTKEEEETVEDMQAMWSKLLNAVPPTNEAIAKRKPELQRILGNDSTSLLIEIKRFVREFDQSGPLEPEISINEAASRASRHKTVCDGLAGRLRTLNDREELVNLGHTRSPDLARVAKLIGVLEPLFTLYVKTYDMSQSIRTIPMSALQSRADAICQAILDTELALASLPKVVRCSLHLTNLPLECI